SPLFPLLPKEGAERGNKISPSELSDNKYSTEESLDRDFLSSPPKKKGRPKGRKNKIPASGWIDVHIKAGARTANYYFCFRKSPNKIKKIPVPGSKVGFLRRIISSRRPASEIAELITPEEVIF
ncbi:MAG: hypothetical protein F6K17_14555, partial [Okeania sp. SIO3C4]|nr:hypothetical protein [Okeania sp. SIO3C4]